MGAGLRRHRARPAQISGPPPRTLTRCARLQGHQPLGLHVAQRRACSTPFMLGRHSARPVPQDRGGAGLDAGVDGYIPTASPLRRITRRRCASRKVSTLRVGDPRPERWASRPVSPSARQAFTRRCVRRPMTPRPAKSMAMAVGSAPPWRRPSRWHRRPADRPGRQRRTTCRR